MKKVLATIILPTILFLSRLAAGQAAPGSLDDQMINAACMGDTAAVQRFLQQGANIQTQQQNGWTALKCAARWAHPDTVKFLLDKGAGVDGTDTWGKTALNEAVGPAGNAAVVRLLLDSGANCLALAPRDPTPLFTAVWMNRPEYLRMMLDKGVGIETTESDGDTPLIAAADSGYPGMVEFLLEKGANIEAKNKNGDTAMSKAKASNHADVVLLLEQASSKTAQSKSASGSPTPPPIPEEARQLFLQASALVKQTSTPEELQQPIEMLRKALVIAPSWGNAYYNLARALELSGEYDDAMAQLQFYLDTKPSDADAAEARDHIKVIQAEKEAAASKKQQNENLVAMKYVSGGITRMRYLDAPALWHN
jgi:ankyrin repeat protein